MEDAQLVRLRRDGRTVAILTVPEMALQYRQGKVPIDDVLLSEEVYDDVNKGRKTGKSDLRQLFGTDKRRECCKAILEQGDIRQSTAQRAARAREKWNQVAENFSAKFVITDKCQAVRDRMGNVDVKEVMRKAKVRVDADSDVGNVIRKYRRAMQDQLRCAHVSHAPRTVTLECVDHRQRDEVLQKLCGKPVLWRVKRFGMYEVRVELYSAAALDELKKQLHGTPVEMSRSVWEFDDDNGH